MLFSGSVRKNLYAIMLPAMLPAFGVTLYSGADTRRYVAANAGKSDTELSAARTANAVCSSGTRMRC